MPVKFRLRTVVYAFFIPCLSRNSTSHSYALALINIWEKSFGKSHVMARMADFDFLEKVFEGLDNIYFYGRTSLYRGTNIP